MSRFKTLTRSVLSGYFTIAANTIYTFVSIPLALHYLSTAEYGLWGVSVDIAGYFALIDAGMSGSTSRLLIDHKDKPNGGDYGSIIKTGALVGVAQGIIVLLVGGILSFALGNLLRVPTELRRDFSWLMIGQIGVLSFNFITRIFLQILVAHQRYDIPNYVQGGAFLLSLAGMWTGLAMGFGVLSFLAVQIGSAVALALGTALAAFRLKLLPSRGCWGVTSWQRFKELFDYGGALFIFTMGLQFLTASQTILLTRFMGLEAAGIWTAATRLYRLIFSLIYRTQEFTGPSLAEMFVRGEMDRMRDRLRDMAFLTTNMAVFGGFAISLCNNAFVQIWTQGRISWTPLNDVLLGLWLIVTIAMRAHLFLAGATKRFAWLSAVCFAEGFSFIGLNLLLRNVDGITRMLCLSILCTITFTLLYSFKRTQGFFSLNSAQIAGWHRSTWQVFWRLAIAAPLSLFVTRNLGPAPKLAANASVCAFVGSWIFLRYGFGKNLHAEIADKLPTGLRRIFRAIGAA